MLHDRSGIVIGGSSISVNDAALIVPAELRGPNPSSHRFRVTLDIAYKAVTKWVPAEIDLRCSMTTLPIELAPHLGVQPTRGSEVQGHLRVSVSSGGKRIDLGKIIVRFAKDINVGLLCFGQLTERFAICCVNSAMPSQSTAFRHSRLVFFDNRTSLRLIQVSHSPVQSALQLQESA